MLSSTKVSPLLVGVLSQENLKNCLKEEMQMTIACPIGATSHQLESTTPWDSLPWRKAEQLIARLQMRIAKAVREKRMGRAKTLQRILSTSFYAKALAVKGVTQNKGGKTPGVDGIVWRTPLQKINAVNAIKGQGYKPSPLKRIYINKKEGRKRPLSIPTLADRAQQAIWKMALAPIAEEWADPNSYGFRPKRSAADAMRQCHSVLAQRTCAQWILEGDIEACFDRIDHKWLLENIPMDKKILKKFLEAGFMEGQKVYPTTMGTPQGGILSPTIALMALSGLEKVIKNRFKPKTPSKVNVVSYCDDFIITGASKEILQEKVIPMVREFLAERGLTLSDRKTKITNIKNGFNFLGHQVKRLSPGKVHTKPSKENLKRLKADIRSTVKHLRGVKPEILILNLNPKIRGWCNYFRHGVSKRTFAHVDSYVYKTLSLWARHRHPNKSKTWALRKYFSSVGNRNWVFTGKLKAGKGEKLIYLVSAQKTPIRRHIKIRKYAHPYDPQFKDYFKQRDRTLRKRPGDKYHLKEA